MRLMWCGNQSTLKASEEGTRKEKILSRDLPRVTCHQVCSVYEGGKGLTQLRVVYQQAYNIYEETKGVTQPFEEVTSFFSSYALYTC